MIRKLTPIERLQKSAMSVERLRAEMTRPTWENTLTDAKAGDDIALLKVEAATELYNQGHPVWSPTAKKIVYATNIEKRADAQEKTMSSIFRGSAFDIKKSEIQEFEFRDGKQVKVTPEMDLGRPKPTDATKRPFPPADTFLEPNPDEALTPVIPGGGGDVTGAGTMLRDLNLLTPTEDEQTDGGAMFKPTTPGVLRMGDAYVGNFREPSNANLEAVFKRRGALFTDLLLGPEEK